MGMAASQARLLTLTARIHDVEYEAQALQNAKIQLATQSDYAYQDYLKALDETSLTVLKMDDAGNQSTVTATFNNLCSLNRVQTSNGKGYALFDSRGRLIVDDNVYKAFGDFTPGTGDYNNATCFAMYIMGINVNEDGKSVFNTEKAVYDELAKDTEKNSLLNSYYNNAMSVLDDLNSKYSISISPDGIFDNNSVENNPNISDEDKKLYEKALLAFRMQLYRQAGEEIYDNAEKNKNYTGEDFDYNTFQYYVSMYNQIKQAGGCVPISFFNNDDAYSNAANDSNWLKAMIQCGKITMAQVTTSSKDGSISFFSTSPNSDDVVSYTRTTDIDKTALAKAEAEYEHKVADINKKDERFDLELSKLETERNALTTEYDSVKKVIEDNVKRTFGIFS